MVPPGGSSLGAACDHLPASGWRTIEYAVYAKAVWVLWGLSGYLPRFFGGESRIWSDVRDDRAGAWVTATLAAGLVVAVAGHRSTSARRRSASTTRLEPLTLLLVPFLLPAVASSLVWVIARTLSNIATMAEDAALGHDGRLGRALSGLTRLAGIVPDWLAAAVTANFYVTPLIVLGVCVVLALLRPSLRPPLSCFAVFMLPLGVLSSAFAPREFPVYRDPESGATGDLLQPATSDQVFPLAPPPWAELWQGAAGTFSRPTFDVCLSLLLVIAVARGRSRSR